MQILESEKRRLIPLVGGVLIGVAISPIVGTPGILASLALLYVGAMLSGLATMRRAEDVERSVDPAREAVILAERAWTARPEIGADERARLIRIMNLARTSATLPS